MKKATPRVLLKTSLVAGVWTALALVVGSRWVGSLEPWYAVCVVVASMLTWSLLTVREFRQERSDYLFAALVAPLLCGLQVGASFWCLEGFPPLDVTVFLVTLHLVATSFIAWPVSFGIAVTCRLIIGPRVGQAEQAPLSAPN